MARPVVHLYTLCWDEADMLGFFFRHYEPWVDRFVVYDDGSTDGSLEILRAHPRVERRRFERRITDSFVLSHQGMQDTAWKESRGQADWVVITAIDEHLHLRGQAMADYLAAQGRRGTTLIPALGFDMHAAAMPDDHGLLVERVARGRPRSAFNKLSIFDPNSIRETGFGPGRHAARPAGHLRLPDRDEVMLWHYKHLGFERNAAREASQAERLGRLDRQRGYGQHYLQGREALRQFWDVMESEGRDLAAEAFDPAREAAQPLWWRAPGFAPAPAPSLALAPPAAEPTVSVLVKCYNHAPYVGQTVRSLLSQSFQDFEIVVTDDGSTDGTAEVVRGFDDPRIRLAVLPANQGISAAMNATIARARGRYLAILNSDDWALPGRLQRQVDVLDAHPEIGLVFGLPQPVDEAGRPTAAYNDFDAAFALPDFSRRSWLRRFFYRGNCLCAPTAMIRREAYDAAGPYDVRLTNLQDLDMWIRMLLAGQRIHVLAEAVTAFRIRDRSANASAPRSDSLLRTRFETSRLLRHFTTMAPAVFEDVFAGEGLMHVTPETPVPLRLAELARRHPAIEYQHFAVETYFEHARDPAQIARLRVLAGELDSFGSAALGERDTHLARTAGELRDAQGRIAELEQAQAEIAAAAAGYRSAMEALRHSLDEHEAGLATAAATLSDRDRQLDTMATTLADRDRRLAAAQAALDSRERHGAQTDAALDAARETLAQLRLSTSWRMTAPVRAAGRALPLPLRRLLRRALGAIRPAGPPHRPRQTADASGTGRLDTARP
ncbi:glycosyltransferase [Roseicella sp. DB1501]|uniref:glycosyltransferase family 2 protein n=1 Tax=Roseicella sp. DB1501 TaxID=2730925 RepID=UPI001491B934|nr:glycosyltransferase [Roseicella sp. DB1501]NOG70258.1 glycosyltransferase [Roseicella sp. DB1501]